MKQLRAGVTNGAVSKALLSGVSTLSLLAAAPLAAQEQEPEGDGAEAADADEDGNAIIVTGIRASLESAQNIRRNADTVVDVVTASDIGALPDRSVSEVLQRVPGVSIIRFAGPNDPDHFAIEGAGAVIRGLPFVRSELNGRDVFGASPGAVLGFDDVSPELLSSVAVFKNSSADLIEGGAAGTIDLRTRLPFDSSGQVISASAELNYGDLREEFSPTFSGLYSNNWETGIGSFGILGNVAYTELKSRADGTAFGDPLDRDAGPDGILFNDDDNLITDAAGNPLFIPSGGSIRSQEFDRERLTIAAAAQFESLDGRWLATAQFFRSDSDLVWGENVFETVADAAGPRTNLDQSDFVFDDDGVFESGTITDTSQWRGPNATAALVSGAGAVGGQQLNTFRTRREEDRTEDYGFNLKFAATDRLRFNFDAQYITTEAEVVDLSLFGSFFAPVAIDRSIGAVPDVSFVAPDGFFNDPSNFFLRAFLDHTVENEGDSVAFRGDVEYDFSGDGWLKSVRGGVRYNQQDLLIRESDFNWGAISEVWTANDIQGLSGGNFDDFQSVLLLGGNPNPALDALVAPVVGSFGFDSFQRGNATVPSGEIPSPNGISASDFAGFQSAVSNILAGIGGSPSGNSVLTERAGVIPGTPFLPSEIGSISRDNIAAYVRLDFESPVDDAGVSLSGNVGLRYARTDRTVDTSITSDPFDTIFPPSLLALCDPTNPATMVPGFTTPAACSLDLAAFQTAFGDGQFIERPIDTDYDEWLPSLNLKLDIPGSHVIRLAVSRTLTRPDVDQLNERIFINQNPGEIIPDGAGGTIANFGGFQGNQTGTATLLPQTSWNFDVAWEWYFAPAGSITVTGFYKEINNFIAFQPEPVPISFEGVDIEVLRNAPVNAEENATVTGFEVAYQQFFDFLPGALSGLGVQFNYTYIDAEGVSNEIDDTLASDDPPTARFEVDDGIFPRISDHTFNLVGLYEKGPIQARVAYNWRSSFQLTERDVIFPFASIFQPSTGQLDASIFFDITDNVKVGVQGVNLLDDITVTEQSISATGQTALRNAFRNDRRYTFIARVNF